MKRKSGVGGWGWGGGESEGDSNKLMQLSPCAGGPVPLFSLSPSAVGTVARREAGPTPAQDGYAAAAAAVFAARP